MWNAGGLAVASKDSAERSRSPRAVCTTSSVPRNVHVAFSTLPSVRGSPFIVARATAQAPSSSATLLAPTGRARLAKVSAISISAATTCRLKAIIRRPRLLRRAGPVVGDGLLEVRVFLAGDETDPLQRGQMLLGLGRVVGHQVRLADVLVSAAMAGVELQRLLVVREGRLELAALAIGVAEVILDVRVARVAERGRGKRPDRAIPVLGRDGRFPRRIVRVEPSLLRLVVGRIGANRARQQGKAEPEHADPEQAGADPDAEHRYRLASRCFISRSSERSPSEFRVSLASFSKYSRAFFWSPENSAALAAP